MKYNNKFEAMGICEEIHKNDLVLEAIAGMSKIRITIDSGGCSIGVTSGVFELNDKTEEGKLALNYVKSLQKALTKENTDLHAKLAKL